LKLEKSTNPKEPITYTISFPVIIQSEFTEESTDSGASEGVNINGNSGADFEFMTTLNIVRSYSGLTSSSNK
jgi:hypothetical protein